VRPMRWRNPSHTHTLTAREERVHERHEKDEKPAPEHPGTRASTDPFRVLSCFSWTLFFHPGIFWNVIYFTLSHFVCATFSLGCETKRCQTTP
jgi:hypothetical protein